MLGLKVRVAQILCQSRFVLVTTRQNFSTLETIMEIANVFFDREKISLTQPIRSVFGLNNSEMFPFASFGFLSKIGRIPRAGDAKSATLPRAKDASDSASVKKKSHKIRFVFAVFQTEPPYAFSTACLC